MSKENSFILQQILTSFGTFSFVLQTNKELGAFLSQVVDNPVLYIW